MLAPGNGLIFPDERGDLTPFSLICRDCGQAGEFIYRVEKEFVLEIKPNGHVGFKSANDFMNGCVSEGDFLKMVADRHARFGSGGMLRHERYDIRCARCSSPDVVLYGEILADCYESRCVGCFQCGGAFAKDNIMGYCVTCVGVHRAAVEDQSFFWEMLDMDLYCNGCPLEDVREGYGIMGDDVRRKASGKLV